MRGVFTAVRRVLFAVPALFLACSTHPQSPAGAGSESAQPVPIAKLRGAERSAFLDREVIVEGYYYDGSIPMIVDDFQRVLIDPTLPLESYIPLVGSRPPDLKSGDRVSVRGKLVQPGRSDPPEVQGEPTILRVASPGHFRILERRGG